MIFNDKCPFSNNKNFKYYDIINLVTMTQEFIAILVIAMIISFIGFIIVHM